MLLALGVMLVGPLALAGVFLNRLVNPTPAASAQRLLFRRFGRSPPSTAAMRSSVASHGSSQAGAPLAHT